MKNPNNNQLPRFPQEPMFAWHLLGIMDSVSSINAIMRQRVNTDPPWHGHIRGRMTHTALQLTHHGIELGLKWLFECDAKQPALTGREGHNLIKLLCELTKARQQSLCRAYNWHMRSHEVGGEQFIRSAATASIPTLHDVLETYKNASFTSRYVMEVDYLEDLAQKLINDLVQGKSFEELNQNNPYFASDCLLIAFSAVVKVVCNEFPPTDDPNQNLRPPEPIIPPTQVSEKAWVGSAWHDVLENSNLHFRYQFFSEQLAE